MDRFWGQKGGFALPTVLIASVVMLIVLTVSVSSVVAIRTALQTQHYEQLAKTAGEAGVAYAKACLAKNGNVPLWNDEKPLTPATDCAGNELLEPAVDVLVVGGGGGGGGTIAGGGGGGGVVEESDFAVTTGTYAVTVGGGGLGGVGWDNSPAGGASGGNSSFAGTIVAQGGGGGGGYARTAPLVGGSGGGGAYTYTAGAAGTVGQGFAGGTDVTNAGNTSAGGGGAGGVGHNSTTSRSGDGGPGKVSTITGAAVYYGGGGGGGSRTGYAAGLGGIGGGGNGTTTTALAGAGQPNSGGGGGGAGHHASSTARVGGSGGSGVVIVRYPTGALTAVGGTVTTAGLYTIHTFTGNGTFMITSIGSVPAPEVSALIVGGGGSGGGGWQGGGGGAGGVIQQSDIAVSAQSYPIVVGAGGAGGSTTVFNNGNNSSAFGFTAIGGGKGAGEPMGGGSLPGVGGSGGGGSHGGGPLAAPWSGAAGTAGQGNAGGSGYSGCPCVGGGGGGAGTVGQSATSSKGGNGGAGIASSITGSSVYYGGGGGGSLRDGTGGTGGVGGGGNAATVGVSNHGYPGVANTGGGGGAGYWHGGNGQSGAGGSGVVIIRYPNDGTMTATGGTITDVAGDKVHRFTSSGTFTVTSATIGSGGSCPTDPRCSVVAGENFRSSFRIGLPTLDDEGKAIAIPNTGYVELLRASNGAVWRVYRQPSVQAAIVPGLCSGAASSTLGWANSQVTTTQTALPNAGAARNISIADGDIKPGDMYFRKDFQVSNGGNYFVTVNTPSSSDKVDIYVNGSHITSAQGSLQSGTVNLSVGCYTITARLTNSALLDRASSFIAAVQQDNVGAAPIVVTDSDWRVSAGAVVDFSHTDYDADPSVWGGVTHHSYVYAPLANSTWTAYQSDVTTPIIAPATNGCTASCPGNSYTFLRDGKSFYVTGTKEVLVSTLCDDRCVVYVDGQQVVTDPPWATIGQQTITLNEGYHHVGVRLYNAATGQSGVAVSVVEKPSNVTLTRTDLSWRSAPAWFAGTAPANPASYESGHVPSPNEIPAAPAVMDVLVVAGGGGGGGNCNSCGGAGGGGAGGLIYTPGITPTVGSRTVTVGGGGSGGSAGSQSGGSNGGNSVFGSITATGGGAGKGQNGASGNGGGSGGGGSGGGSPAYGLGGMGIAGQGFAGAHGLDSPYPGGGGGGASTQGMRPNGSSIPGHGGSGFITYLDGTRRVFAGGGGGGTYGPAYVPGRGDAGTSGNGSNNSAAGGAGVVNTGGGGGGGNGYPYGTAGGNGGSGVVMVRFPTGALTVSVSGSGTYSQYTANIKGVEYTIYRFTAGTNTFTISAVNF